MPEHSGIMHGRPLCLPFMKSHANDTKLLHDYQPHIHMDVVVYVSCFTLEIHNSENIYLPQPDILHFPHTCTNIAGVLWNAYTVCDRFALVIVLAQLK